MSARLTLRMATPSIVVSFVLLAVGALSGWYISLHQRQAYDHLDRDIGAIRASEELILAIYDTRFHLVQFSLSPQRKHLDTVPQAVDDIGKWLQRSEESAAEPENKEHLRLVRQGLKRFTEESAELFQSARGAGTEKHSAEKAESLVFFLTDTLLPPAQRFLDATEDAMSRSNQRHRIANRRMALGLLLLGICGAVGGLVAGFGIAHGVSRAIVELHVPIRTATGKLEEVVGPLELNPASGIENLDSVLHKLADQVGTVVDRLQQSQLEVLRAEQLAALGQLAAGLAHELRNPMTSMKILVQSAAEEGPHARLEGRDLTVLEEELTRLEKSLETFLRFARPPQLQKRSVDLSSLLRQTIDLVSPRASQQRVRITWDDSVCLPRIEADAEHLRQVLLNLVLNALDMLPQGGGVTISTGCEECPEGSGGVQRRLVVSVADTGPGIPPELGDRLFQPFASTKETGLGLGLATSRRVVEAHGGTITAANAPAGGAVFTVSLPVPDQAPSKP